MYIDVVQSWLWERMPIYEILIKTSLVFFFSRRGLNEKTTTMIFLADLFWEQCFAFMFNQYF